MRRRTFHLRECVGGAQHGARLRIARHDLRHERAREPQVAEDRLVDSASASGELGKGGIQRARKARGARVRRDALAHACEQAARVVCTRRRGVATVRARRNGHVHVSLLGHAHHGHGLGYAQGSISSNSAALVHHHVRMNAAGAQPLDSRRGGGTSNLLAIGREVVHVARGHVTLGDEQFDGLEDRGTDALGVERAAGPDLAVDDLRAKGVVLPCLPLHRHDVLVRHGDNGVELRVGAGPTHEDAEAADGGELARLERFGVEAAERADVALEGGVVDAGGIGIGDRGDAEQLAETLDLGRAGMVAAGVYGCARRSRRFKRARSRCNLGCHAGGHRYRSEPQPRADDGSDSRACHDVLHSLDRWSKYYAKVERQL